jgi:uncharacterized protein
MFAFGAIARAMLRLSLVAALLFAPLTAGADVAVPPLQARVTDLTGTLDAGQKSALEQKLAAFEKRKGAQIAVLMLPTTQPETIEQYAVRVEESWKLGRKGVDDGALLVVAKDDRKLRIETGYGLEGVLPDAIAKRIISDDIVPRFKQGDFYGGISAGIDRMLGVIDGEQLPAPPAASHGSGGTDINNLLAIGFVLVFVVGGILRAIFGRFIGAGVVGGAIGFMAWSMSGTLIFALFAAVVAFIIALFGNNSGGGSWGGGYSSGGGFSSDGGGFSGGGGSSGGGGASGSW